MENELAKENIKITFEELNVVDKELVGFIYKTEYGDEIEYMKCERTKEYFNDAPPGVWLIYEDRTTL